MYMAGNLLPASAKVYIIPTYFMNVKSAAIYIKKNMLYFNQSVKMCILTFNMCIKLYFMIPSKAIFYKYFIS